MEILSDRLIVLYIYIYMHEWLVTMVNFVYYNIWIMVENLLKVSTYGLKVLESFFMEAISPWKDFALSLNNPNQPT